LNRERYHWSFRTYWLYEGEWCPCCGRRKVEMWATGRQSPLSLNTFLYNEMDVLIGYLLCSVCAMDLLETSKKRQTLMHQQIERCLRAAYHQHLGPSLSETGGGRDVA